MNAELSKAAADRADVARVRAGDVEAFAAIVCRWQAPLINLAYRFCHDRGRAEEMAQEAFLRAYRALSQFRGDAAFSTWLFALATNLYRSEVRRIPQRTIALEDAPEPADQHSISDAYEARDRDRAVRRAVQALPEKYREALILFYFHEMDVPAAAQSLGPAGRYGEGKALSRARTAAGPNCPRPAHAGAGFRRSSVMADMANDDELDRAVDKALARSFGPPHSTAAHAESIEPSSGFTASVMDRVRAEASHAVALGPIAFPWLRAVPGICMAALAVAVCVTMLGFTMIGATHIVSHVVFSASVQGSSAPVSGWAQTMTQLHLGWLLVALAIAFLPLIISRTLIGRGRGL